MSILSEDDINKAHLSRYLCVRTSGFLENVLRLLVINYADGTSPQQVQNFLTKRTKYFTNLDYKKILKLLAEFSQDWQSKFEDRTSDEHRASINSVVSNRNNISHGNSDSISYNNMKEYYKDIKEVVKILREIIAK